MAKFSNIELREVVITYLNLIIKRNILTPGALKETIVKSYNLGGIDEEQEIECFCAFDIAKELEELPKENYTKKDILALLDNLYKDNYINNEDYYIFSYYLVFNGLLSAKTRQVLLKDKNIDIDLLDNITLKGIIKELIAM